MHINLSRLYTQLNTDNLWVFITIKTGTTKRSNLSFLILQNVFNFDYSLYVQPKAEKAKHGFRLKRYIEMWSGGENKEKLRRKIKIDLKYQNKQ